MQLESDREERKQKRSYELDEPRKKKEENVSESLNELNYNEQWMFQCPEMSLILKLMITIKVQHPKDCLPSPRTRLKKHRNEKPNVRECFLAFLQRPTIAVSSVTLPLRSLED